VDALQQNSIGFCREFRIEQQLPPPPAAPFLPIGGGAGGSIGQQHEGVGIGAGAGGGPPALGAVSGLLPLGRPPAAPQSSSALQPLMYFDGCPKPAGVTLLLRGGDAETLRYEGYGGR
jgi:hypothetical protein